MKTENKDMTRENMVEMLSAAIRDYNDFKNNLTNEEVMKMVELRSIMTDILYK